MEKLSTFPPPKSLFIFDLEFVGDVRQLNTCKIWEIAVFCVQTQQWFDTVVDPDPSIQIFPEPPIPEIPQLTRQFLLENKARTWLNVFEKLQLWINTQCRGAIPIFISHNTFRADKPIMELECRRYNIKLPIHWYFFDSLHYSRRMIKNTSGNYSLSGLHEQLFQTPILNAHRARNDVSACAKILHCISNGSWQLLGPIYPSHMTSLRSIRWIGQKAEEVLFQANIRSVEQLLIYIQDHGRQNFIYHQMNYKQSIEKTLSTIMGSNLPQENVKNIAKVLAET